MVTAEQIRSALHALNAAENDRPNSTVEATSARIDKLMSPAVQGWRNGAHVASRAAEREVEKLAFGALEDYHRDFENMIIEAPKACITWVITGSFQGAPVRAPGCSVFEFGDDGLVKQYWMYINPADFAYRAAYVASLEKDA